jgi:hypothetical protein
MILYVQVDFARGTVEQCLRARRKKYEYAAADRRDDAAFDVLRASPRLRAHRRASRR